MARPRSRSPRGHFFETLEAFIQENELDSKCEAALLEQSEDVQREVMSHYVTGTNKSAVVMRRIREAANARPVSAIAAGQSFDGFYGTAVYGQAPPFGQPPPPPGHPPPPPPGHPPPPPHGAPPAWVMAQAQAVSAGSALMRGYNPNPNSTLAPEAAEGLDRVARFVLENQLDEAVERSLREQPAFVQRIVTEKYVTGANKSAVVMRRIREVKSLPPDPVTVFSADHDLDDAVEQALRSQPPHIQEQVMAKYVTGQNKSAVVMRRIRDAGSQPAQPAPPPLDPVACFLMDNQLDSAVEQALRSLPVHLQGQVMEKYVTGHNKSAVVMRRIRDIASQPVSSLPDPVTVFVQDNQLDAQVEHALRSLPADLQSQVMEKYVTGNNKSAVVMRRIRDMASQPAAPRDAVAIFVEENLLDAAVEQSLRSLPAHLQAQVMEKYVTGQNRSAVVMRRIRDITSNTQPSLPSDPVAVFVEENQLDAQVESALRALPEHLQDQVMEKYVTGKNKSAVVMRRIRDARI